MPERRLSRLFKAKLLRRSSTPAVPKPGKADPRAHPNSTSRTSCAPQLFDSASDKSPYSLVSSAADHSSDDIGPSPGSDHYCQEGHKHKHKHKHRPQTDPQPSTRSSQPKDHVQHRHASEETYSTPPPPGPSFSPLHTPFSEDSPSPFETPLPTPQQSDDTSYSAPAKTRGPTPAEYQLAPALDTVIEKTADERRPSTTAFPLSSSKRPSIAIRRQSLLPASQQHLIKGLLEQSLFSSPGDQGSSRVPVAAAEMVHRRIWVKRPGGSATLVPCLEDAVVDELRDQVIMKYANSLGRTFDSPDIVIRIPAREGSNRQHTPERLLSPEEVLSSVLDSYYPGGQTVEEALLIEAPTRRTPKPSPRLPVYLHHHSEPGEHGDYFPLMPVNPNGHTPPAHPASSGAANAPSISILTTGVPPALPSPGSRAARHHRRPPLTRHTTNSPTMLGQTPSLSGMSIPMVAV
jgi:osomolarity two-component system response regulator SSK1